MTVYRWREKPNSGESTLAWHNWCAKRALDGSSSSSVNIWCGLCGHMSQNGEKIHSETEMNINFIFLHSLPSPSPLGSSTRFLFLFFFVCLRQSFRSTTANVVGCYCNIKWKIPEQLFPAARSSLRHFLFLSSFESIPACSMANGFVSVCVCGRPTICVQWMHGWCRWEDVFRWWSTTNIWLLNYSSLLPYWLLWINRLKVIFSLNGKWNIKVTQILRENFLLASFSFVSPAIRKVAAADTDASEKERNKNLTVREKGR